MTEAEEQSIIAAAEEALKAEGFAPLEKFSCKWIRPIERSHSKCIDVVILRNDGLCEYQQVARYADLTTILRYKEIAAERDQHLHEIQRLRDELIVAIKDDAKSGADMRCLAAELTQAREGAANLANSLAASHAETAKAISETARLAKEVERLRKALTAAGDRFDTIACNTSHDISALAMSGRHDAEAALQGGGKVG